MNYMLGKMEFVLIFIIQNRVPVRFTAWELGNLKLLFNSRVKINDIIVINRQKKPSVETLLSPLSSEFWRLSVLSGGTQRRKAFRHAKLLVGLRHLYVTFSVFFLHAVSNSRVSRGNLGNEWLFFLIN